MDSDRLLGTGIIVVCIIAAILYFGSLVFPWWNILTAVKVVVSIAFVLVLGIGGWIGWTMASTPSPEPVEDLDIEDTSPEDMEETDFDSEEEESTEDFQEELCSISGMTENRAQSLKDAGYDSKGALVNASEEDLTEVKGIGSTLAARIKEKYV